MNECVENNNNYIYSSQCAFTVFESVWMISAWIWS